MKELRELARKLLDEGTVKAVIGYELGPRGVRPAVVTDAAGTERLIFDERCVHNLAAYLSPRRPLVRALGPTAVVCKPCDARAAVVLERETQLDRKAVVLIGVRCGGVLADPHAPGPLGEATVAGRCAVCDRREPVGVDYVLGEPQPAPPRPASLVDRITELDALEPDQRLAFWATELAACTRCNACRQVCPLCTCERCIQDKTQPQWIESSPHPRANFAWHLTRAQHLAGRCVGCGECERACPAHLPLSLLNRKVAQVVEARFGYRPAEDPKQPGPIGAYRLDDEQEFIR